MLKDKITGFFVSIDDFCIDFESEIQKHLLESSTNKSRKRAASLSDSEIMSILVLFHYCQFSNFKNYYNHYVSAHMKELFPGLVSQTASLSFRAGCQSRSCFFKAQRSRQRNRYHQHPLDPATTEESTSIRLLKELPSGDNVHWGGSSGSNYI